jgi:glycosyltransferase involved in cell wall biosynthesis
MVVPEYPPGTIGGGGTVYRNIAYGLKQQGHRIIVFSGDHKHVMTGKTRKSNVKGLQIHFIPLIPAPRKGNMDFKTYTPPTFSGFLIFLKGFLQIKSDIIHLHGVGHPLVDCAGILSILLRRRYIFTCHGIPKSPEMAGKLPRLFFRMYLLALEKLIISKAKALTAVSHSLLEECKKKGLTNDKMYTITNGINHDFTSVTFNDVERIREKYLLGEKRLIFSIGRLSHVKGFQYLITALPFISASFPNSFTVIAGSGPYRNTLLDIVKRKNLSKHIKLAGWVSEKEKYSLYKCADLVVFPSIYEPFGMVILEAMSMRKPIIAFNKPPMSEIIENNVDGLLVKPGDVKKLANAILRCLTNDKLKNRLAENACKKSLTYQWEHVIEKYRETYFEANK